MWYIALVYSILNKCCCLVYYLLFTLANTLCTLLLCIIDTLSGIFWLIMLRIPMKMYDFSRKAPCSQSLLLYALLSALVYLTRFAVKSQLNGSNGEVTGSDDVDSVSVKSFDSSTLSCDSGQSQKSGSSRREKKKNRSLATERVGLAQTAPVRILNGSGIQEDSSSETLSRADVSLINTPLYPATQLESLRLQSQVTPIPDAPPNPLLDGLERQNPIPEDVTPDVFWLSPVSGFRVQGKVLYFLSGDMLYFVEGSHEQTEIVNVPACVQFGCHFETVTCLVNRTIYNHLMTLVGNMPDQPRNYTALRSAIRTHFKDFPAWLLEGFISHYAYRNSLQNPVSDCIQLARNNTVSYCTGMIEQVPSELSVTPDYFYNGSFKILFSKGFNMKVNLDMSFSIKPTFTTHKELVATGKDRHQFFRFRPHVGFVTYGNCAANTEAALSRYFKQRAANEVQLAQNQIQLLTGMPINTIVATAMLCDATVDNAFGDGKRLVTRGTYLNYDNRDYKNTYILGDGTGNYYRLLEKLLDFSALYLIWLYFCSLFEGVARTLIDYIYTPLWYLYDRFDILKHFVQLPHPKRSVYMNFFNNPSDLRKILSNKEEFVSKFKNELGKVGKVGRLYATIGAATLADVVCGPILKAVFRTDVRLDELYKHTRIFIDKSQVLIQKERLRDIRTLQFTTSFSDCQEPSASDKMFARAASCPTNCAFYFYYSDDGFFVINLEGVIFIFETDISSCDSSNKFALFACVRKMGEALNCTTGVDILLSQCARPTTLFNPDNKSEFVTLQPETFMEYSGTKLTTILNNLASNGVAMGIYEQLCESGVQLNLKSNLERGANRYGWVVTVDERETFNKVTFLKRAYNGTRSWKVLGCIFRSLGTVDGTPRADSFGLSTTEFKKRSHHQLVDILIKQCADQCSNEPGHIIINAIRERAGLPPLREEVSLLDLQDRYGGEEYEWLQLCQEIVDIRFGTVVKLPILELIFNYDYSTVISDITPMVTRGMTLDFSLF